MARSRDYKREYAKRVERAKRRGFESPYAETYVRAIQRRTRGGETISEALREIEVQQRQRRIRRDIIKRPQPKGWWTLPIWIYKTEDSERGQQNIDSRFDWQMDGNPLPMSEAAGAPFERWIPYPMPGMEGPLDLGFADPQEADNYCRGDTGAYVLWWLWAKQL